MDRTNQAEPGPLGRRETLIVSYARLGAGIVEMLDHAGFAKRAQNGLCFPMIVLTELMQRAWNEVRDKSHGEARENQRIRARAAPA